MSEGTLQQVPDSGLVYDWNETVPRGPATVLVQDETLREGLQSPTVADPPVAAKIELLHLMHRLGVDCASLGLPIASARQYDAATRLCCEIRDAGLRIRPNCGGRTLVGDVRPIVEITQRTGIAVEACLFIGSSPIRQLVEGWDLQQLLQRTREAVAFAVSEGLEVTFITEDTTRSSPEHLRTLMRAAIDSGARRICLCDTVGCSTPEGVRRLVGWTVDLLLGSGAEAQIDWHGHQDRGLGLANALAAIQAGADRIHATALGFGERVGNTSMEQLLVNLRLLGLRDDDLTPLPRYVECAAAAMAVRVPANAPVVGRDAFRTATGVHAAAVIKARREGDAWLADRVYSSVPASWLARTQEIEVGPMSGAANVRERIHTLGLPQRPGLEQAILERAKACDGILSRETILDIARAQEREPEPVEGNYFVSNYPPFSVWDEAGAVRFDRTLEAVPAERSVPLGLYVHLPFCVKRCRYCYYLAYEGRAAEIGSYLEAVYRELATLVERPALAGRRPEFVYFGGGTPSMLPARTLETWLRELKAILPWDGAGEVSFECAPQSVTVDKLRVLRGAGVTRVSLGVQQWDDDVLESNGRVHRVQDVERAWAAIRQVGFDVVNLDLIVGLVGQTDASFMAGLERVLGAEPESITLYQLEIPLNTPLYRELRDGSEASPPASWPVKRARLAEGFARLERAGYTLRSAYSAVRDPRRHRFVYQDEQYRGADLIGVGASAFSHLAGVNHQNLASLKQYMAAVSAGGLARWRGHDLDDDERLVRELILQLKLGRVEKQPLLDKYGTDVGMRFRSTLDDLADEGFVVESPHAIDLTRAGLLRVDRLIPRFYQARYRGVRYS